MGDGTVAIYHVPLPQRDNTGRQSSDRLQQKEHRDHQKHQNEPTSSLLQPAPHGPLLALRPVFQWKSNPAHGPTRLPCELAWKVDSASHASSSSPATPCSPNRATDLLAAGFQDGSVLVWRLQLDHLTAHTPAPPSAPTAAQAPPGSKAQKPQLAPAAPPPPLSHNPILSFRADSSLIRSLAWLPAPLQPRSNTFSLTAAVRLQRRGRRDGQEARNGKHWGKGKEEKEVDDEEGEYGEEEEDAEGVVEEEEEELGSDEKEENDGETAVDEGEESTVLIVGSQSGILKFWDLRDVFQPAYESPTISRHGVLQLHFCTPLRALVMAMEDGSLRDALHSVVQMDPCDAFS
ncbi:unnamed protein product [Closterium sp. Yama58-4]|nr:unnamed protein product [Closterium sp. Yama58-4]